MRTTKSEYTEMLFENRNKAYGAYELRTQYENRLMKSFGFALLIAGLFFLIPFALTQILTKKFKPKPDVGVLTVVFNPIPELEKVAPKPPAGQRMKSAIRQGAYKITKHEEEIVLKPETTATVTPIGNENSGTGISPDSSAGATAITTVDTTAAETFSAAAVDVIPEFPGGEKGLMKFFKDNLKYPEDAKENKITGRVYISFIVDEKGEVEGTSIMRGLGYGTEEEVIRVFGMMPKWKPGKFRDKAVKTAFVMPVFFNLK